MQERVEIRVKKVIKRKGDKLYVKGKGYDNSFNSWIDKKTTNMWIFSKTKTFWSKYESWIKFFNYPTKADLKNARGFDTPKFAKRLI